MEEHIFLELKGVSKTQTSNLKNSDPLGVSKTQTLKIKQI